MSDWLFEFVPFLSGIVSLVSFSLLSLERYAVVLGDTQTNSSRYHRAKIAVAASWFYSLFWTLPPLLGWSRSVIASAFTFKWLLRWEEFVFRVK